VAPKSAATAEATGAAAASKAAATSAKAATKAGAAPATACERLGCQYKHRRGRGEPHSEPGN
jgi:hypothetical protein